MKLTEKQERYLKKNLDRRSLTDIAKHLGLDIQVLKDYLGEQKIPVSQINHTIETVTTKAIKKDWQFWLSLGFLALLVIIAYIWTLNFDFVSDDVQVIARNPQIGSINFVFSDIKNLITPLLYFIFVKTIGLAPWIFRLTNIFFHLGNCWLIYLIISLLGLPLVGLISASLFAIHPVLIESVTWISGGVYTRYTFFFLLSFYYYLLSKKKNNYFILCLVFYVLSLLSADKAIVIPLIFITYEFSQSALKKNFKKLLTLSVISFGWLLIYLSEIGKRVTGVSEISYSQSTGIENPLVQIPVAIGSYIKLLFWPSDLTLYHSNLVFSRLEFVFFILILLLIAGGMVYGYRKNRLVLFWLSFFVISLFPTLTPLKISWVIAERYVYMGTIGIFFLVGLVISRLFKDKEIEIFGYGVLIIILSLLMVRTIVRNNDWRNEDNLWISMANISSADPKTHNNLGDMYARHKQYDKAVEEFTKGIVINPNYADAYHNRGNTYAQMGKYEQALADYQKAIDINPKLWQSHQNIAAIFYSQKKYSKALEHIQKAIDIKPVTAQELSDLYANLATVQLTINDKQLAVSTLTKALEINPQSERIKKMLQEINK